MTAASDYLENKLLDHVLRQTAGNFSAPGTVFVALFTTNGSSQETALEAALEANTTGTDASTKFGFYEVNNGSYARQSITFGNAGASTTGTISSNQTVSFPVATANYQSPGSTGNIVSHIAIMDNNSGTGLDNVLFFGQLTTSKTVSSGDQFTISSGNLSVSLA